MDSEIGSRTCPIVLLDDEPVERPPDVRIGTKGEPIILSSDDENEQGEVEEQLLVSSQSRDEDKDFPKSRYIGDSPSRYSFNGTGVAYDIMLSMGYLPGQGLGPHMKGNITPVPVPLRKRKRGLGFESLSPPPSPQLNIASTSTPANSDVPKLTQAASTIKKSKLSSHNGKSSLPHRLTTKSETPPQSTSTFLTKSEPSLASPATPHNNWDSGFENYVSTLSGLAMAAMPSTMRAAAVADPMTAFQLAQTYFSQNFGIPSSLLPNMPPFPIEQTLPTMATGSSTMASNGYRPLPPAKSRPAPPVLESGLASKSSESKDENKKDINEIDPFTHNPKACIGWIVQPKFPNRGVFQIIQNSKFQTHWGDMHEPRVDCCLIMEDLPNVHRDVAFVRSWSDQFDPKPAFGVVDTAQGKSLIEFLSPAAARAAYLSPRLLGQKYEKAQHVRVFWYRPVDDKSTPAPTPGSSSSAIAPVQSKKSMKKEQKAREKNTEVLTKGVDVVASSLPRIPSRKEKGKQPVSSISTQPLPTLSKASPPPKKPDPTTGSVKSTTVTVAPISSEVARSRLEHKSAPVAVTRETGVALDPDAVETVAKSPTPTKQLESRHQDDMLVDDVGYTKAHATVADGSSRPTRSAVLPCNSTMLDTAMPVDPPHSLSNHILPAPLIGVSPTPSSEPPSQWENIMEQRLRVKLLAKKQLAALEVALRPTAANVVSSANGSRGAHSNHQMATNHEVVASPPPPSTSPPPERTKNPSPPPVSSGGADNSSSKDCGKPLDLVDAPSLDNLATSFIAETLQSAQEKNSVPLAVETATISRADIVRTSSASASSTTDLAEKQRVLAQRIAESKLLMKKYQTAHTKEEKDKIMQLLKEQNRLMGASKSSSETQVTAPVATSKFCWPQSVSSGILIVSDDEDDMDES